VTKARQRLEARERELEDAEARLRRREEDIARDAEGLAMAQARVQQAAEALEERRTDLDAALHDTERARREAHSLTVAAAEEVLRSAGKPEPSRIAAGGVAVSSFFSEDPSRLGVRRQLDGELRGAGGANNDSALGGGRRQSGSSGSHGRGRSGLRTGSPTERQVRRLAQLADSVTATAKRAGEKIERLRAMLGTRTSEAGAGAIAAEVDGLAEEHARLAREEEAFSRDIRADAAMSAELSTLKDRLSGIQRARADWEGRYRDQLTALAGLQQRAASMSGTT